MTHKVNQALLVSLSAPELDRLAVELAARKALVGLVRRYANKNRWWERSLAKVPRLGALYASTFGRRLPPAGLDGDLVIEAGVTADISSAVVRRVGSGLRDTADRINTMLQHRVEASVANVAGGHVKKADVVVASYHVARHVFRRARASGRRTILNYPIAHHRWQYRFYDEQARAYPEFAAALPQFGSTERHSELLDAEIELADTILVGSQFARDSFVSVGVAPEKLRVIPYGSDTERFRPAPLPHRQEKGDDKVFRLLFVGQIGERKGMSHLLKAYKTFRRPDTELHLVGDYVSGAEAVYAPYREIYKHTANVPQKQLPDLFRAADVFVFPTLVEGMGMVVLEAMACGIPVIVTPNGPGDVVRDGVDGYVVPPCDADAIVERLERLYAEPELRAEMGRNARRQAESWSWARYARTAAETVLGLERSQ
jgi:glycosyltransferase involved in cell wall biosynthesis